MVASCVKRFRQRGKPTKHEPKKHPTVVLSRKANPYERYFAALLSSPTCDFEASSEDEDAATQLWSSICERINLQPLHHPIESKYADERKHFAARAALVLEESRHAIADGLVNRWRKGKAAPKSSRATMKVTCQSATKNHDTDQSNLKFQLLQGRFSKEQMFHNRPGTVMEVLCTDQPRRIEKVWLGCILPGSRDEKERDSCFSVMVFQPIDAVMAGNEFEVTPIAGLISELRQFEACTSKKTKKVPFLTALLGSWPKHTRFHYDDDDTEEEKDSTAGAEVDHCDKRNVGPKDVCPHGDWVEEEARNVIDDIFDGLTCVVSDGESVDDGQEGMESLTNEDDESDTAGETTFNTMTIPQLNKTQEDVASQFLRSSPGTITLVQGPPGTGKSTLLVAVICRYLLAAYPDGPTRLMVSAPTNKAVTVVASRFLKALNGAQSYNVVMVGDGEKLLDPNEPTVDELHTSLRSIFIYSWMAHTVEEYRQLRECMAQQCADKEEAYLTAARLRKKLLYQLPFTSKGEIASLSSRVVKGLKTVQATMESAVLSDIDDLIVKLEQLPNDAVCQELLNSANVIFTTLASAGATMFMRTPKINDLIVDEAAAATEPLLYIPFHLRPRRLLVVGDPQQLPATVMSKRAMTLGYDKSLHERLMRDCQCPYTMLDVQYRMKPEISSFPSSKFYQGKILNGNNVHCPKYSNPQLNRLSNSVYSFFQVDGKEEQAVCGSYRNRAEAQRVVDLIHQLQSASSSIGTEWHGVDRVRIITFYRAQVLLIQQLLNKRGLPPVLVATVDSSQGCEAELVVVSFVRSNSGNGRSRQFTAGFLTDDRRINVALTRAKFQLICIGNVNAMGRMRQTSTLFGLASDAKDRKCVVADQRGSTSFPHTKRRLNEARSKAFKRRKPYYLITNN